MTVRVPKQKLPQDEGVAAKSTSPVFHDMIFLQRFNYD